MVNWLPGPKGLDQIQNQQQSG